jgi:hypothetical protein
LTGLLGAIVFFRNPDVIVLPSLEAEDGAFIFPHYYANRDLAELLRIHAGYIPLVLNLIAYISVRLPTTQIPYGFALLPAAIALITYLWLFGKCFRPWLGPDSTRATICVLLALAPLAQYHVYANTTYSIWNTLVLFLFMTVTPLPRAWWRNMSMWTAANLLVWSNPLTILAAPILAVRLVRDTWSRWFCAFTLANLLCYSRFGIEQGGIFAGLTWIEALQKLARAVGWTIVLVAETAFRTVFGSSSLEWAATNARPLIAAWACLIAIAASLAAWQSPRVRVVLGLLGYVIIAYTFISFLSRGVAMIPIDSAPRYVYAQTFAFLIMFVLLIEHFLFERRLQWRTAVTGVLVVWYFALNVLLGHYFFAVGTATRPQDRPPSPYVQSHDGNGFIVREFFVELAAVEKQNGSRKDISLSVDKPGDWPIIIDTRETAVRP